MSELVLPGTWPASVVHGRWVVLCSWRDRCDSAAPLQPFTEGFVCPECRMATTVAWPSADMVAGIERLLLMRPHWKNRNWNPGETLGDLLQENADHGILTRHAAGLDPGPLIGIEGDRIVADALPTLNPRRELVR